MPSTIKTAVNLATTGPGWRDLYTCPALTTAVVRSVIASNTAGATVSMRLGISRAGVVTTLANGVSIVSAAAANLIAGPITLQAGDKLVTEGGNARISFQTVYPMNAPTTGIVDGALIIFGSALGIWRSADNGATWAQVSSLNVQFAPGVKIGSSYFFYTSATTAVRSTDGGLTWSAGVAVTNAPILPSNSVNGGIIFNGSVWGGLNATTTNLVTTSDGITWALSAAFPNACSYLVWSGSNWIATRNSTSADIYYSPSGASWTTVAAIAGGGSAQLNSIASNGAGIVVAIGNTGTTFSRSTDHGASWTSIAQATAVGTNASFWSGSAFYLSNGTGSFAISTNAALGSFTGGGSFGPANPSAVFLFNGGIFSAGRFCPTQGIPTVFYGMDVTASLIEVS